MKKEKFLRFLRDDIAEPTARAICKQLGIPPVKFN